MSVKNHGAREGKGGEIKSYEMIKVPLYHDVYIYISRQMSIL